MTKQDSQLGIGTNYNIDRFTKNILFDEKIGGTVHLALGRAYAECCGVNKSVIHWDMIKWVRPGKITIDDDVIQRDGDFTWPARGQQDWLETEVDYLK